MIIGSIHGNRFDVNELATGAPGGTGNGLAVVHLVGTAVEVGRRHFLLGLTGLRAVVAERQLFRWRGGRERLLRRVRAMLIGSYKLKAERRVLERILRTWHEFAVHKTVETRSRSQLRASLKAQEALTAEDKALEKSCDCIEPCGAVRLAGVGYSGNIKCSVSGTFCLQRVLKGHWVSGEAGIPVCRVKQRRGCDSL